MKRASIDIGSNTILLLIAEVENQQLKVIYRDQRVTSLGKDLDKNKNFCQESMDDSYQALSDYQLKLKEHNISLDSVLMTATEASRVAKNAKEFYQKVESSLGLKVITISGQGEAYYSALGACLDQKDEELTLMDIGGASTELIKIKQNPFQVLDFISLPIGSVRLTSWIEEGELEAKMSNLKKEYSSIIQKFKTQNLLCVAGMMTSIANMSLANKDFIESQVHNLNISTEEFYQFVNNHKNHNAEKFLDEYPFLGKRAKAINGGIYIAKHFVESLNVKNISVSTYGLMFGTTFEGKVKDEFRVRE